MKLTTIRNYIFPCILLVGMAQGCKKKDSPKPIVLPQVTTSEVTDIRPTAAKCGGRVDNNGNGKIQEQGICWGTNESPSIDDKKVTSAADTGSFTVDITELVNNTTYYVRAYAKNEAGVGYGNAVKFIENKCADNEGNIYTSVAIGSQVWMVENLKVTKYKNGDLIQTKSDTSSWNSAKSGLYCNFNNDATIASTYGRLYNWTAVTDARGIAPEGWHVPSKAEWETLIEQAGGLKLAGGALKETGFAHWDSPNVGATNSVGFSALPGGTFNFAEGLFDSNGYMGYWWTTTPENAQNAYTFNISSTSPIMSVDNPTKVSGFSVRCVKNN